MSAWPATLPAPQLPGYEVAPVVAFERSEFDSGPARQRQRFTAVPENVSLSVRLTPAQMVIFRDFWRTTIHHGTDAFTCDKIDVGNGIGTYDLRATGPYRAAALPGMHWEVSFPVEVLNG